MVYWMLYAVAFYAIVGLPLAVLIGRILKAEREMDEHEWPENE